MKLNECVNDKNKQTKKHPNYFSKITMRKSIKSYYRYYSTRFLAVQSRNVTRELISRRISKMPSDGGFYFENCFSPHNHRCQLVDSLPRRPSSPPSWWWTATAVDRSLAVRTPGIAHQQRPQSSLWTGCADGVARFGDAPHSQAGGQSERGGGEEESAHGVQVGLDFSTLARPLMLSLQATSIKHVDDVNDRDRARPSPPLFEIDQRRNAHPPAAHVSSSRVDDRVYLRVKFIFGAPCYPPFI